MDYTKMELDELKELAKSRGLKVGNIGKDKLIVKIKENDTFSAVTTEDEDLAEDTMQENVTSITKSEEKSGSLLDAISETIDELDEAVNDKDDYDDTLELDTSIPVKSITFGGLTYKSRSTNAVFRWNQIGAIQYMTVAELNEMNNYKSAFLNKPLVILMDERAVKKFRLAPVYENVAKLNNLKEVFNSDMQTIERVIDDALRVNMRDILINKVRQMYKTGKLVNINVIRLLEKKLSFDLSDQN
jgi:hypothetical protein